MTDICDTTQSVNGTSKKITADNVAFFFLSDTAYSSAFNGITDHRSKQERALRSTCTLAMRMTMARSTFWIWPPRDFPPSTPPGHWSPQDQ